MHCGTREWMSRVFAGVTRCDHSGSSDFRVGTRVAGHKSYARGSMRRSHEDIEGSLSEPGACLHDICAACLAAAGFLVSHHKAFHNENPQTLDFTLHSRSYQEPAEMSPGRGPTTTRNLH